jgi:hypothetical protein
MNLTEGNYVNSGILLPSAEAANPDSINNSGPSVLAVIYFTH